MYRILVNDITCNTLEYYNRVLQAGGQLKPAISIIVSRHAGANNANFAFQQSNLATGKIHIIFFAYRCLV